MGTLIRKKVAPPIAPRPAPVAAPTGPLAPATTSAGMVPPPPPPPPGANTPAAQQATISPTTNTGLPGVNTATTNVPQTQKQNMQQQIPPYLLQELLMGARYNNPYMSGISGPYQAPQMPQYAGLQNIAPWAMPQNPSMYGGGFGMPYQNNQQYSAPNMNNLISAFLGAWR